MEQQIVVKTEMGNNGEILLFYVNESDQGVLTAVENIEGQGIQLQHDTHSEYILSEAMDIEEVQEDQQESENVEGDTDTWLDDEINRLLMFYNDNKQTFLVGVTKRNHLWSVACKTMLIGKTAESCELQFQSLKLKYIQIRGHMQRGIYIKWPFFEQCHQAFQDDDSIRLMYTVDTETDQLIKIPDTHIPNAQITVPAMPQQETDGIMVVKKVNNRIATSDEKVEMMLNLYLKYKNDYQKQYRRGLWETIALELGEDDPEYWHKRFLNFKQHYIHILDKRKECGDDASTWPYAALFDKIFKNDIEFQRKYANAQEPKEVVEVVIANENEWNDTELTVLVKYCFDCLDEFQDSTIPNSFLWNEIGRLLDKPPEKCKEKYEELKNAHLDNFSEDGYVLRTRKPLAILFDNIISKEVEQQLSLKRKVNQYHEWDDEELDVLVNFLYENIDMYKDPVCYFVCWAKLAKKLKQNIVNCRRKWEEMKSLYKSILDEKKENPDMEIDWRYMELFDRIFDYGMDTTLLTAHDKIKEEVSHSTGKVMAKKVNIKMEKTSKPVEPAISDDEDESDTVPTKRAKEYIGSSRTVKILEFYHKNKEKFSSLPNKYGLWSVIARQLGVTASQCMKKFKSLKQHYTSCVEKELNNEAVTWPHYALCKKVYGYRAIKSKLKGKKHDWEPEDWSDADIKKLIHYFNANFDEIDKNTDDISLWGILAERIKKTEYACKEKFLELRKSYRKLRTRSRNPDVKISWKFFQLFDQIYSMKEDSNTLMIEEHIEEMYDSGIKTEAHDDDDYQCIIVLQEGQELKDIREDQIILKTKAENNQIIEQNNRDMMQLDQIIEQNNRDMIQLDQIIERNSQPIISQTHMIDQNSQVIISQPHMIDQNSQVIISPPHMIDQNNQPIISQAHLIYQNSQPIISQAHMIDQNSQVIISGAHMIDQNSQVIISGAHMIDQNSQPIISHTHMIHQNSQPIISQAHMIDQNSQVIISQTHKVDQNSQPIISQTHMIDQNSQVIISDDHMIDQNSLPIISEAHTLDQNQYQNQNIVIEIPGKLIDENNQIILHDEEFIQNPVVISDVRCVAQNNQVVNKTEDKSNIINPQPEKTKVLIKWTKRTKKKLLVLYLNYLRSHKRQEINPKVMWREISSLLKDKTTLSCRKMFAKLKANHTKISQEDINMKKTPYYTLLENIQAMTPKFTNSGQNKVLQEGSTYKNVEMDINKVQQALQYYLLHIEDFASPRYEKKYLWSELANFISEPVTKVFNKINYLKQLYNSENPTGVEVTRFAGLLQDITAKELAVKLVIDTAVQNDDFNEIWTDDETEKLLEWYLSNLDKFKNPKFVRSYLWVEVSSILKKSPLDCSKKMGEIRTQYRNMVRDNAVELSTWRFHDLCQKIYGTGKKGNPASN